jgi:sorbitol/mannitol transport system permease protein
MTTTVQKPTTTTDAGAAPKKKSHKFSPWGVVAWLVGLGFFFPVFWMVLTAFKQESDAATSPPKLFFTPTLDQFKAVFEQGIGPAMLNSIFATGISTILVLLLGTPAAFALSLRPVRKTQDALFFFMSTKMLPVVAAILPLYVIVSNIGLLDNIWALVILYTSMNLPIAVWMMRSFLAEVPVEVLEAAQLDGCGLLRTLRTVVIPMVLPGIAATSLICFIFSWNELLFARVLTATRAQTAPVFLTSFVTSQGLFLAKVCAAAVVVSLPVIIAGFAAQDKLVQGLSMGAVK